MKTSLTSGILTSLPGRYAKALFDAAREKSVIGEVESGLRAMHELIESSKIVINALQNPAFTHGGQIAFFDDIGIRLRLPEILNKFIRELCYAGRIKHLSTIINIFHTLAIGEKGEAKIEIISVVPLALSQRRLLKEKLKQALKCPVHINYIKNQNILGGIIIRIGSQVYDASLATRFDYLATALKGNL